MDYENAQKEHRKQLNLKNGKPSKTGGLEFIPTNDVFHHFTVILRLQREKELQMEIFKKGGYDDISISKIDAWVKKTGTPSKGFRTMPREALDAWIRGLHEMRLVED